MILDMFLSEETTCVTVYVLKLLFTKNVCAHARVYTTIVCVCVHIYRCVFACMCINYKTK